MVDADEQAVARVLDDFHAAAAAADEERYFAHLAEDAVFLGTDATERWDKSAFRAYAHPYFERGKAWSFRSTRRAIQLAPTGTTAWFDEDLATPNLGPARGSGVLELRGGVWLITQYNLALTVPNERFPWVKRALDAPVAPRDSHQVVAELRWLSGAWRGKNGNEIIEEQWSAPEGNALIGTGRTIVDGKTTFFEFLRIELREGHLVYVAQPMGGKATEFTRVVSRSGEDARFENSSHDWPKSVRYTRTPRGISVRVDGAPGARVEEYELEPLLVGEPH